MYKSIFGKILEVMIFPIMNNIWLGLTQIKRTSSLSKLALTKTHEEFFFLPGRPSLLVVWHISHWHFCLRFWRSKSLWLMMLWLFFTYLFYWSVVSTILLSFLLSCFCTMDYVLSNGAFFLWRHSCSQKVPKVMETPQHFIGKNVWETKVQCVRVMKSWNEISSIFAKQWRHN